MSLVNVDYDDVQPNGHSICTHQDIHPDRNHDVLLSSDSQMVLTCQDFQLLTLS
jgi:hypothetical protein